MTDPCPHCGYCPTCKRATPAPVVPLPMPIYRRLPWRPYSPWGAQGGPCAFCGAWVGNMQVHDCYGPRWQVTTTMTTGAYDAPNNVID